MRKNRSNNDFSKIEELPIRQIIKAMEQSDIVPTPNPSPLYDGWTRLRIMALGKYDLYPRISKLYDLWLLGTAAKNREYQQRRRLRIPKWLSAEERSSIRKFYDNCPEGYHVDHIIPLQGENVSGLHVLANLQYLPARENLIKSNKYVQES